MICKHILLITFLNEPKLILNDFKYFYLIQIIKFIINHFLHKVKWFQVLLYNSKNLTSVIFCTYLYPGYDIKQYDSEAPALEIN